MNLSSIPVIMYHSVKLKRKKEWVHPLLSLTVDELIRHFRVLKALRLKTYFFDDLLMHIEGVEKLPNRGALLTFDDGYKDNWTFVFPLLKKYGYKATIWVNPEFVDPNDEQISPTLEDYWNGKVTLEELQSIDGFLNWAEMRKMEKSGLVDIQSHTMSHARYPISKEIVDFVSPLTKIDWLHWNLFPKEKINYLRKNGSKIPLGHPIYKSEKGNIARIVKENGNLTSSLIDYIKVKGGTEFFANKDWKTELQSFSDDYIKNNENIFTKESENEYESRLKYELDNSKLLIENNLQKKVTHLCWPYGGWDDKTIEFANASGYKTTTASGIKNTFNRKNPERIQRISFCAPKYRNTLGYPYSLYRLIKNKFSK